MGMENHDYFEILRGNRSGWFETVLTIKKSGIEKESWFVGAPGPGSELCLMLNQVNLS